jgi:hypothetical protein
MTERQTVIATACNDLFAPFALNLVGSIKANTDIFDAAIVYDLGMSLSNRSAFRDIDGVELITVPAFAPHYLKCWSWKLWVYNNAPGSVVLYVDAGSEALRNLSPIVRETVRTGYFVISQLEILPQGHYVRDIVPGDYYAKYGVSKERIADHEVITAGVIGFRKGSPFYRTVIQPGLDCVMRGDNLGWSAGELRRNSGIHYMPELTVRDCVCFRHDQTILNLLFYKTISEPKVRPMKTYAPLVLEPDETQYIWNPRRGSSLRWIDGLGYSRHRLAHRLHNKLILRAGRRSQVPA